MTFSAEQTMVLALLGGLLAMLVWGRWRYDLVAFGALIIAVIIGVVPGNEAFSGFGHPATVIIALVLVVSYGLAASGAVSLIARHVTAAGRSISAHIAIMSSVGAALSGIMNNVGALALLMPVDIEAARKEKRSPALTLMPLSFATILGGLVTLIGTPPNIIISTFRERELNAPFQMFDFAPVGLVCALAGVIFIALIGWRLIPQPDVGQGEDAEVFKLDDYLAELTIAEESKLVGETLVDVEKAAEAAEVQLLGVMRDHSRLPDHAGWVRIQEGDVLLLETKAEKLDNFATEHNLAYVPANMQREQIEESEFELVEVVVRPGSPMEGRTSASMSLVDRYGTWLIGVQRQGRRLQRRVRRIPIQAGDVLLLIGPKKNTRAFTEDMSMLPLAKRGLEVGDNSKALLAAGMFGGAIALSSVGLLYLPVALGLVTVLYVLTGIVPLKQLYETIEWPVVVLIGSLIPIGLALETSGATEVLARGLVSLVRDLPPWAILTIIMALTMTLSDVLNNTATALVAAPIALQVSKQLGVNPDAFLMAVAVAASCAFLTPIGHKNNTLIMGPGGYKFGDYWRLGLPLEILVVAVGAPMIMLVWPL
ncbi:MAG: SLC13 family permease [Hyphomicrobiaceae bacterium]